MNSRTIVFSYLNERIVSRCVPNLTDSTIITGLNPADLPKPSPLSAATVVSKRTYSVFWREPFQFLHGLRFANRIPIDVD